MYADILHDNFAIITRVPLKECKDGAWIYATMHEGTVGEEATPEALTRLFNRAEFASAGTAEDAEEEGERLLRGVFRKVDGEMAV